MHPDAEVSPEQGDPGEQLTSRLRTAFEEGSQGGRRWGAVPWPPPQEAGLGSCVSPRGSNSALEPSQAGVDCARFCWGLSAGPSCGC